MDISEINGVGPSTTKLLNKLNIYNMEDLLTYYPYRYNIYSFSDLINNENISIMAIIEKEPVVYYIKKNFNRMNFRVLINNNLVNVTIFNRAFYKKILTVNKQIVLIGKYDEKKNIFTASDIKFNIKEGDIESIYHLTKGLSNNTIAKLIKDNINNDVTDLLPSIYRDKYHFISKKESISKVHFPKDVNDIKQSKVRLKYEELFNFSFKMNILGSNIKKGISKKIDREKLEKFINNLPFTLTVDQRKVVDEIIKDEENDKQMNRLVLGDVGSGKTLVALISIYSMFISGYQSALMAPTEILAQQHYNTAKKLFEGLLNIDIITGSMKKNEKKKIYQNLKDGKIDLIIGTHSILNDEIAFNNLGLVITDEQHRFGVNQRMLLENKGCFPDVLYLSATPIPRTYALTIYGDLDISIIKQKPNGRKEIITTLKKENEIKDVLYKMLDEIKLNHQIYIVCPLVESSDDLTSVNDLKGKIDVAFNNKVKSAIIHGKLKQADKDIIMNNFKENDIKILISTTVIEVGIDNPNATMIVIFDAERFGLATLHQLRGRVGRGEYQSYCYLISNYEKERLKVMEESNDGFYISEMDFKLRGHGDLFGTKQHGDMSFKIADIRTDYQILLQAKSDSKEFINNSNYLNDKYYNNLVNSLKITD